MKIGGLQPFTLSDYPGQCAAIIFTIGCNFCCPYCHNTALLNTNTQQIAEEQVFAFLHTKQKQLDGVVITGGEPTVQPDLCTFIQKIKNFGYKVKLDTNGTHPAIIKRLISLRLIDYIAMDVKAPIAMYRNIVGTQVITEKIQESIDIIAASNIKHIFRTTWDRNLLTHQDITTIQSSLPHHSTFVLQNCRKPSYC